MTDEAQSQFGALLREWRQRRHMSQLDLALRVDVSTRHLSYVETGRSNPSPTMISRLGEGLDLALRERNTLFLAAGYAPAYGHRPLTSPELTSVADALRLVLDRHHPYPAVVLDRSWDVLDANAGLNLLVEGCAAHLLEPPVNVLRLTLHPDGMAPRIQNLAQWRSHLLSQLQHRIERTADAGLSELLDELLAYPGGGASRRSSADVVAALRLDHCGRTLSLFSITSHIDSAADVTIDEMILETFYPADQQSAELL
ncbi:MAG: helix-turn-helix domain-containing protein, partial [Janthinobacterium lividum]